MELKRVWMVVVMLIFLKWCWCTNGCLEQERTALLQLKPFFNNSYISLQDWVEGNKNSDCCLWERVYCNAATTRVIILSLGYARDQESREWYLNTSLFLPFEKLEALYLDNNHIAGWVENEGFERLSSRLSNLRILDLSYNSFNDSIFSSLIRFSSLKSLYLANNNFTGSKSSDIKGTTLNNNFLQTIGKMNSLEILSLNYSGLSGTLPTQGLCELTRLRELYLDNNDLEGNLPECLANLTSLQTLDLSVNKFTGNIATSPLKSLTSIRFLSLWDTHFQIPISLRPLFNHSKLKSFYCGNNEIYAETESDLLTPKFQLNTICLFGYGYNGAIPKFLYRQHDLQEVYIYDILFEEEFPNWLLDNNTELNRLILVNTSLSGPFHLPIHSHMHLQELHISNNFFYGQIPTDVGAYFPRLTSLDMSMNAFSHSIPSSFGDMNRLEYLLLSNNHFTGRIPDNLSNCSSLEELDISKNHILGKIPRWMGNSSLEAIIMSNNHLEGPIPSEFCHLDGWVVLDISENNLYGSLPSCFSLSNFNQVYLSKNRLQGPLPSVFSNNSFLVSLDLSYNHFTGRIPDWIGKVYFLSYLLLNNNHFIGEIPIQLCQSYFLSLINLSHNNLSGPIPFCLNITSLGNGTVASENTSMPKHVEFTTKTMTYSYQGRILNYMSGIDLSCNKLTGEIPYQIGYLIEIHVLNFSHNSLTGSIPPTFSNLKQVESLDLSYNNLSGRIPPQLSELNFLVIFNVAHNYLSGKIPERTAQFATFEANSYEGNPLLCGQPLPKSCTANGSPPSIPRASIQNGEGSGFIDMDSFYVTFSVSYITMLLGIVAVLYINPYWRQVWFYMIEMCITSCYYFVEDNLPKRSCHRYM